MVKKVSTGSFRFGYNQTPINLTAFDKILIFRVNVIIDTDISFIVIVGVFKSGFVLFKLVTDFIGGFKVQLLGASVHLKCSFLFHGAKGNHGVSVVCTEDFTLGTLEWLLRTDVLVDIREAVRLDNTSGGEESFWIQTDRRFETIDFTEAAEGIGKVADSRTTASVCDDATVFNTALDNLVIDQWIIHHSGIAVSMSFHLDTIKVTLVILWRDVFHILAELRTD